ncbi:MAG: hypothetical protein R2711_15080 [Acidimicrobiales bacterium]
MIADIDRDQKPEIILGGDIWPGNPFGVPRAGWCGCSSATSSTYGGYPRSTPGGAGVELARRRRPERRQAARDHRRHRGNWPEPNGRRIDAFTARNRANLPGWPVSVDGRVVASPAVGDIDDDGALR